VNPSAQFLSPSEAARRLGVSVKALRLYEQRGLIAPARTAAGWRAYGPDEMSCVAEIAALRELGLSLSEVARVLGGDSESLEPALAAHQAVLEGRVRQFADAVDKVRRLRADITGGRAPAARELARPLRPARKFSAVFDLPWPWGGERFELHDVRSLNYIIGPLGSGKTRLAKRIAETVPGAAFLGLDRLMDGGATASVLLDRDPALKSRVDATLAWLVEDGATVSEALIGLLAGLETEGPAILVIDMLEQGLDRVTQEALIARLRRRVRSVGRCSF
jgi:DNA-binding transcriptional MerR regulator